MTVSAQSSWLVTMDTVWTLVPAERMPFVILLITGQCAPVLQHMQETLTPLAILVRHVLHTN